MSLYDFCRRHGREALLGQWHPAKNGMLTPRLIPHSRMEKVWWRCENGHEWREKIKSRTLQPECPRCRLTRLAAERKKKKEENKG